MHYRRDETISALATAHGTGAIAVLRLSGPKAIEITEKLFCTRSMKPISLKNAAGNTVHFGCINDNDYILDEVLVTLFRNPHSFTGEDVIEISCHGSVYIQQQLLLLLNRHGARPARPGEFTMRAFMNGKMDLSQAEAVADLVASQSSTSHQVAMAQMRGGFSEKIRALREHLLNFASLIELELDFSEEDVEFADRSDLKNLLVKIDRLVARLLESFEVGNVIKHGIPVAIVGKPNAGKSTLLNALLEEERAIVSDIPGTTRDTIEDEITIDGILYRFIDTAGLRNTTDTIESIGVSRSYDKIRESSITLYVFDVHEMTRGELNLELAEIQKHLNGSQQVVLIGNQIDRMNMNEVQKEFEGLDVLFISAKEKLYIDDLRMKLVALFDKSTVNVRETIVTNVRHADALRHTHAAIERTLSGINNNIPGDLIAQDIREALHHLGEITGEVTNDELLGNIFGKFCIGK
jgi:tRNA modification GTPase